MTSPAKSGIFGGKLVADRPVLRASIRLFAKIVLVLAAVTAAFSFVFGFTQVRDEAMSPNLLPGDLVMFYRLDTEAVIGEVFVVEYKGQKHLGRVVALPGDVVDFDESGFLVNGSRQFESRIFSDTLAVKGGVSYPLKLAPGQYFVLGDNRGNTVDSRVFGPVDSSDIHGKVFTLVRRRGI